MESHNVLSYKPRFNRSGSRQDFRAFGLPTETRREFHYREIEDRRFANDVPSHSSSPTVMTIIRGLSGRADFPRRQPGTPLCDRRVL